jgi:hypothetical protein
VVVVVVDEGHWFGALAKRRLRRRREDGMARGNMCSWWVGKKC